MKKHKAVLTFVQYLVAFNILPELPIMARVLRWSRNCAGQHAKMTKSGSNNHEGMAVPTWQNSRFQLGTSIDATCTLDAIISLSHMSRGGPWQKQFNYRACHMGPRVD